MPLEAPLAPLDERARDLNARYAHHAAMDVLEHALFDPQVGSIAMVSSFGAESVALLHMVSVIDRSTPVLFLDTEMLFPETLEYQRELSGRLGLSNVSVIKPDRNNVFLKDPNGGLHKTNPDACCDMRKTVPLNKALAGYDAWVTGRKRFHGGKRASLEFFEAGDGKLKINPLAHWSAENMRDYIDNNKLPKHPLASKGFSSVGCLPCTTRTAPGEDPRAGRWRGQDKEECGIHFVDGKIVRGVAGQEKTK